jgi:hypothetical protein
MWKMLLDLVDQKRSYKRLWTILLLLLQRTTTRCWSCQRIATEVSNIPGISSVSASSVYRDLKAEGYGVYKRTTKPGLKKIRTND